MVKLAKTLGHEIYPELANLPIKTNHNNSNIKEDWIVLPEQSSIATSTESLPWFHARTKKSSLGFSKQGICTKGQSQPQDTSEGYNVSRHPSQLASSESLPDLTKEPRREVKWLPAKKGMERKTTEPQREQKKKDAQPKLLQRKNSAAQRKPVGIDDDIILSPIIFRPPPSPVCDYPSFQSHPFRLVIEEDEEEEDEEEDEEEEEDDDDESESSSCCSPSEGDGETLAEKADDLDCESQESLKVEWKRGKLLEWKRGELVAVDPTRLAPPDVNGGVVRKERRQGWSGEWNQPHIQDVIEKLRALK
jgi:hypothetical protein